MGRKFNRKPSEENILFGLGCLLRSLKPNENFIYSLLCRPNAARYGTEEPAATCCIILLNHQLARYAPQKAPHS